MNKYVLARTWPGYTSYYYLHAYNDALELRAGPMLWRAFTFTSAHNAQMVANRINVLMPHVDRPFRVKVHNMFGDLNVGVPDSFDHHSREFQP